MEVVRQSFSQWGFGEAWSEAVDADVLRRHLDREVPRELQDAALGDRVWVEPAGPFGRIPYYAHDGSHVHDGPSAGALHRWHCVPCHEVGSLQVHLDDLVPHIFRMDGRRKAARSYTCAIHENIEGTIGIHCALDDACRVGRVRHVGGRYGYASSPPGYRLNRPSRTVFIEVAYHNPRAVFGEQDCGSLSNAGRSPRDDRHFALQSHTFSHQRTWTPPIDRATLRMYCCPWMVCGYGKCSACTVTSCSRASSRRRIVW